VWKTPMHANPRAPVSSRKQFVTGGGVGSEAPGRPRTRTELWEIEGDGAGSAPARGVNIVKARHIQAKPLRQIAERNGPGAERHRPGAKSKRLEETTTTAYKTPDPAQVRKIWFKGAGAWLDPTKVSVRTALGRMLGPRFLTVDDADHGKKRFICEIP